ncbi:MAG TPA: T9SS type A sorting domain-containing protein [Chitinophagaceae bacterium]|nr:T9SS type A sorting domain-containing protein [Chitinophagaceae bacterium]
MKKIYFLLAMLLAVQVGSAQLLQWNTFGNAGTETAEPSVFNDANISSSNLTLGSGVTPAANGNRFGGNNWFNTGNTNPNTLAEAVTGNDYIQFIVTPNPGFSFTPTSFVFSWDHSGTGPASVTLRSSVDGYTADLGSVTAMPASISSGNTITISGLTNLTTATTFRLYGYSATATTGTGGFDIATDVVNVQLNGTTASTGGSSITTGAVSTPPFCVTGASGAAGTVAYTSVGSYTSATFNALLSDATGDFSGAAIIGTDNVTGSNPGGSINITIPAGTATGAGYKIRVDCVTPSVTGSESSAFSVFNGVSDVTALAGAVGNGTVNLTWTNPAACFDEIMIVAKAGTPITGAPTGDGSAYTADLDFLGAGTAFDGGKVVYKGTVSGQTVTNLTNGTTYYFKAFTRRGTNWSAGTEISRVPLALMTPTPGSILINQLSPDYNGASDEYVELVNTTGNTYDLSTLAIRYQSAAGGSGSAGGTLSGVLFPHNYWLLSPNGTVTVGLTNLTRDGAITAGFAGGAGQVALVRIIDDVIIDGVGYGTITGGTYAEGTAATPPPTDGGIKRVTDGVDNNDNSIDFTTVANADILLRNSGSIALPVKFYDVKAYPQGTGIRVDWSNLTELDVNNYTVERSADGQLFTALSAVSASKNNGSRADYSYFDATPLSGVSFYRIRSNEFDGGQLYSIIVRVNTKGGNTDITIYPNPVTGGLLSLQATELAKGDYTIRVFNASGQQVFQQRFAHNGGFVTQSVQLPASAQSGMYNLQLTGAELKLSKTFIVR